MPTAQLNDHLRFCRVGPISVFFIVAKLFPSRNPQNQRPVFPEEGIGRRGVSACAGAFPAVIPVLSQQGFSSFGIEIPRGFCYNRLIPEPLDRDTGARRKHRDPPGRPTETPDTVRPKQAFGALEIIPPVNNRLASPRPPLTRGLSAKLTGGEKA